MITKANFATATACLSLLLLAQISLCTRLVIENNSARTLTSSEVLNLLDDAVSYRGVEVLPGKTEVIDLSDDGLVSTGDSTDLNSLLTFDVKGLTKKLVIAWKIPTGKPGTEGESSNQFGAFYGAVTSASGTFDQIFGNTSNTTSVDLIRASRAGRPQKVVTFSDQSLIKIYMTQENPATLTIILEENNRAVAGNYRIEFKPALAITAYQVRYFYGQLFIDNPNKVNDAGFVWRFLNDTANPIGHIISPNNDINKCWINVARYGQTNIDVLPCVYADLQNKFEVSHAYADFYYIRTWGAFTKYLDYQFCTTNSDAGSYAKECVPGMFLYTRLSTDASPSTRLFRLKPVN